MSRHLGILPIPFVVIPKECQTAQAPVAKSITEPVVAPARAIEPAEPIAPAAPAKPKSKVVPVAIGAGVLWWLLS